MKIPLPWPLNNAIKRKRKGPIKSRAEQKVQKSRSCHNPCLLGSVDGQIGKNSREKKEISSYPTTNGKFRDHNCRNMIIRNRKRKQRPPLFCISHAKRRAPS
jgi:hypothetical protein